MLSNQNNLGKTPVNNQPNVDMMQLVAKVESYEKRMNDATKLLEETNKRLELVVRSNKRMEEENENLKKQVVTAINNIKVSQEKTNSIVKEIANAPGGFYETQIDDRIIRKNNEERIDEFEQVLTGGNGFRNIYREQPRPPTANRRGRDWSEFK
jgi:vacuolar-type H+-ATPase subunit I/STV1